MSAINEARSDANSVRDQFILKIWNDPHNQDVVQAFLKNDFIWFAAYHTDSEALAYYQNYGIVRTRSRTLATPSFQLTTALRFSKTISI